MMKKTLKKIVLFLLHRAFCLFPLRKRVVFSSFGGKQYSCNPRAISIALTKLYPKIKQIWVLNSKPRFNIPNVKIVTGKVKRIFYYATSKIIVDNSVLNPIFKRRKNQIYLETWHGDCSFKRIGMDSSLRFDKDSYRKKYQFNYAVTGSRFGEEYIFGKAIPFNGYLLKVGSPRNDILFENNQITKDMIREELDIDKKFGVLLYAPTFRDSHTNDDIFKIDFDIKRVLSTLKDSDPLHREWVILLRLHSAEKASFSDVFGENVLNVTDYYDMANLLLISDLCISDYSSCAIDFATGNRIPILFHSDQHNYSHMDRELLFEDSELPFLIAYSEKDLLKLIRDVFLIDREEHTRKIRDFYGIYDDGTASKKIASFVWEKLNN